MSTINLGRVKGDKGDAATISLGTVTTGAAGSNAAVTNTGTPDAAIFNFTLPRGEKGDVGSTGPAGPAGSTGPAGPAGPNTVTTSTTTDLNGFIYGDGEHITSMPDVPSNGNLYARMDGQWRKIEDSILVPDARFNDSSSGQPIFSGFGSEINFSDQTALKDAGNLVAASGDSTVLTLNFTDCNSGIGRFGITFNDASLFSNLNTIYYTNCGSFLFTKTSLGGNLPSCTNASFTNCGTSWFELNDMGYSALTNLSFTGCGGNMFVVGADILDSMSSLETLNYNTCAQYGNFVFPSTTIRPTSVSFTSCGNTFSIPDSSGLSSVTTLDITNCGPSGFSVDFTNMLSGTASLRYLNLNTCGFMSTVVFSSLGLNTVQYLAIVNTGSTFTLTRSVDLENITSMLFMGCGIGGFVIQDVRGFAGPNKTISIGSCGFTGSGFQIQDTTNLLPESDALRLLTAVYDGHNGTFSGSGVDVIELLVDGTSTLQAIKASLEQDRGFVVNLQTPTP